MELVVIIETIFITLHITHAYVHIESVLEEHLLKDYNKLVLPRTNTSAPIKVKLGSYLADLSYLRETENVLETNMYFYIEWTDDFLKWNTSQFDIRELSIEYHKIWQPDLLVINGLGDSRLLPVQNTIVHVSYEGVVTWWPGGNIKTKCKLYVSKYPFDSQLCKIVIEPWKLSVKEQIFTILHTTVDDPPTPLEENAIWEITGLEQDAHMNAFYGHYNMAHYELRIYLKRRSLYNILNIVFPVLFLSLISLCSYFIPPLSGEKMSVCVSIFLSFAVYVTIISSELPRTPSGICYFEIYLIIQVFISGCTIVLSALVLHIYHKEGICNIQNMCNRRRMFTKKRVEDCKKIENEAAKETFIKYDNKELAIKLDDFFLRACLLLNIVSFVVYLALSNT